MKGSKKEQIEADIAELEKKAKKAEEQFFISLDLTEFPLMNDIIVDEQSKKKAIEWIAKIVWYLLKRDGEIFTLTQYEQDLIEVLNGKENANYNDTTKKLQESFKKNKGKKIREYKKEYKSDGFYNDDDGDYNKNVKFSNSDFTPDLRVNDIIDELQKLLFCEGFFESFYEEYGEISNNEKEFIDFCKKTIREHIFVDRSLNEEKYLQFLQGQNEDNQQDEQKISNKIIKKNMDNKLIKFLIENRKEVNNIILKELLQNNSINKTEEIKKSLIVFYIEYKNFISTVSSKSPSDMKVFTLLEKYFGEQETKQKKREIKNVSQMEKQKWIEEQLDPISFWKTFSDKYKEDINKINYVKEYKKIKSKNESRLKEDIILKMRDIIVNYSISKDISIGKEEIEVIISLLKRLLYLKGKILTKLEINELANKISKYNPCDKYKSYIKYSAFGLDKQKEIEEHIKKCKNCRAYKDYISSSKTLRENRNKKILKVVNNPYVEEQLNEENYNNINYLKKQFRENPCETNFYYLVSAYIKDGNKKHAEKLLNEGFELYKENIFMKEQ